MPDQINEAETREEVERLRAKLSTIHDPDIQLALQGRIDSLEHQLNMMGKAAKIEEEKVEVEQLAPPTPEQIVQAENLIRQSRVEKMRGNSTQALTLMKEAAVVAPSAPAVLEALGDDFAERKLYKEAKETYKRALALQKENVGLERKYALLAIRSGSMGSIDEQLRRGFSDSPFLTSEDDVASLKTAKMLNFLLPGLGHLVVGRTVAGVSFILGWLACLVFLYFRMNDLRLLIGHTFGHGGQSPNYIVVAPMLAGFFIYICSAGSMGGRQRGPDLGVSRPGKKVVERPRPPVDLPFE